MIRNCLLLSFSLLPIILIDLCSGVGLLVESYKGARAYNAINRIMVN